MRSRRGRCWRSSTRGPSSPSSTRRRHLQDHPGLGLFDELVALLIVACERVGLAGLVVTPSQYHLAVQWTRRLRFAEPRDGARLRALREALGPTPLADVDAVLRAGRVVDRTTGAPALRNVFVSAPDGGILGAEARMEIPGD